MVRRQLTAWSAVALALALISAVAPAARAENAKVAIGDFRWSNPQVQIHAGEHVTWYWAGPDLQHSVTGNSANDANEDSDPGRDVPEHRAGDTFRLTFTRPGTYQFHCKLHPTVAGSVVVDALPGDPTSEPEPDPVLRPDRTPPSVQDVRAAQRGRRLVVRYTLDKRSSVLAEIRRGRRLVRSQVLAGHVGYDTDRLDISRLPPGRYTLRLRPTDEAGNTGPVSVRRVRLSRSSRR